MILIRGTNKVDDNNGDELETFIRFFALLSEVISLHLPLRLLSLSFRGGEKTVPSSPGQIKSCPCAAPLRPPISLFAWFLPLLFHSPLWVTPAEPHFNKEVM